IVLPVDILTSAQKKRLTGALLRLGKVSYDDFPLIRLVSRWDESRLTPFLVAKLELMESDPSNSGWLVDELAQAVRDPDVLKAADQYSAVFYGHDQQDGVDSEDNAAASDTALRTNKEAAIRERLKIMLPEFLALVKAELGKQGAEPQSTADQQ
ncbi:MAG: hypothetical protein ACREDR_47160, partial [Blastocatellia bacterium]